MLETKLAASTAENTLDVFILVMYQNIMLSDATAIISATAEEVKYDTVGYAKNAAAPIGTLAYASSEQIKTSGTRKSGKFSFFIHCLSTVIRCIRIMCGKSVSGPYNTPLILLK
jgi:hypothetical protein